MPKETVLVRTLTLLFSLLCLACLPVPSQADEIKVMVNHAPQSFWTTLEQNDPEGKVLSPRGTWFDPEEADVWVYFLNSEGPNHTLPSFVLQVLESIQDQEKDYFRMAFEVPQGRIMRVSIVDLSKTKNGIDFLGCVAALNLTAMAYGQISADHASIQENCTKY